MFFSWISLDLDLRSQVISWSLLVPSCSIIFTYKNLTPPTIASGITSKGLKNYIQNYNLIINYIDLPDQIHFGSYNNYYGEISSPMNYIVTISEL